MVWYLSQPARPCGLRAEGYLFSRTGLHCTQELNENELEWQMEPLELFSVAHGC
jgi:hypothetical protein